MTERKAAKDKGRYRVIRGISWPDGKGGWLNVDEGKLRSDLPSEHVEEWIRIGAIEPADLSEEA